METQVTTPTLLLQLHQTLELNTRLFHNATAGLDAHLLDRPNEMTNHAAWLTGHLVSARYLMAQALGQDVSEPHPGLFAHGKSIQPDEEYPDLETHRQDWINISGKLLKAVADATPEQLSSKAPFPAPMGDSIADFLAFLGHHETYHLGQLGILRKYFGEEAMKYN